MTRKDQNVGSKTNPSLPESLTIDFKGQYSYPNQFSEVPAGALSSTSNIIIDAPGIVKSRRGYGQYAEDYTLAVQGLSFSNISGLTLEHCSNDTIYIDTNGDGSVMTALTGSYEVPDVTNVQSRVKFDSANNNLYFTTSLGVYKIENSASQPRKAGMPLALGGSGVTSGSPGFMSDGVNVAYRITWLYIDQNDNLIVSVPSDRIIVSNSSGSTADVALTFIIPTTLDATYTYHVYRSNESASLITTPDDNMQLVYTGNPTAGELLSRVITITDNRPNELKDDILYTTTQGAQNANYPPPQASFIGLFKGVTFYGNTSLNQTFFLSLISGSLLVNGDTITFSRNGAPLFTITGAATENAALGQFLVATGGSAAQNITNTATSIVNVVNLYASNTEIDAFYSSGLDDIPGAMTFIDRLPNQEVFSVTSSRTGNVFSPLLPSSGVNYSNTSTNTSQPNGLRYSKFQTPEAVPLGNVLLIGSSISPIIGMVPLQQSLYVFKTDGVFRVTGASAPFSVVPVDVQMRTPAWNTIQALNNKVYAFTEQGVIIAQDDGSIEIISLPIQQELLDLNSPNYPGFAGATWAMAYPSDHRYILSTVTLPSDEVATRQFCFNYLTNSWTTWTKQWTAGYINPTDGTMYTSDYAVSGTTLYKERKSIDNTDYTDNTYDVTITGAPFGTRVISLVDASFAEVGMALVQGDIDEVIVAVDLPNNTVTVESEALEGWVDGPATLCSAINPFFSLAPLTCGDPTKSKQMPEGSILTKAENDTDVELVFSSDLVYAGIPLTKNVGTSLGNFGEGIYGTGIFGGTPQAKLQRNRFFLPRVVQKNNWLELSLGYTRPNRNVEFSGLQLVYRWLSTRQRR